MSEAVPPRSGQVVGIGQAGVDLLGVTDRPNDAVADIAAFSMQAAGTVATAMATLASLGGQACLFGRVGDDPFGQFALGALRGFGVDVSRMLVERAHVTPMTFVAIDGGSHKRMSYRMSGDLTPLGPADRPADLLDGARMVCLDGENTAVQIPAVEKARELGIPVLLAANHLGQGMGELLALSDIVVASERFAAEIAPSGELAQSLVEISNMGPRIVVVTQGEEGALAVEGEKLVRQKAVEVKVADTRSAGDVFLGAFAYGQLRGWSLERCMPFANAAAGLSCRALGAFGSLPTLAEIQAASGVR